MFIALLGVTFALSAQVRFGVFAGPALTTTDYSVKGQRQDTRAKPGVHAGLVYKVPFDNNLFFSPSIAYSMIGYRVTLTQPSYPPDLLAVNNNVLFHEVNLDLLLQIDLGKKPSHFFFKIGPSFDFALFGHEKYELSTGETVNRSMKFSVIKGYGRYNFSPLGELGHESASGWFLYAYYMPHLFSMNNEEGGPQIQNRLTGFTIGRYFQKKKAVTP
jgi:hypothetical protein